MKRIALLTTVGLALFATAAFAHQYKGGHNGGHGRSDQVQQSGSWGMGCPKNTDMNGWRMGYRNRGMMNHNGMHRGMNNTTRTSTHNRRANPAYRGQVTPDTSVD